MGVFMKLSSSDIIDQPVEQVYATVRDHLASLAPFLPNVDQIEVEASKDLKGGVEKTNRWYASVPVPGLLKKFLKPEMFSWIDRARWQDDERRVDYTLESTFGKDLFDAKGTNTFKDLGDGRTQLVFECQVDIYPDRVPGVPKLIAKKAGPAIENLLQKMLEPNLTSLGTGLKAYYKNRS